MKPELRVDIAIIGGGIAGLWLLNRLRRSGYSALLFEKHHLGGEQSVKSQGIIHGGTKYALNGVLTQAANAIADMPARWQDSLEGHGEVDLGSARILSRHHYMWSRGRLASRMTTFFASKALRGRVADVPAEERPEAFRNPAFKGNLYALNELVLDVPSVIQALARPYSGTFIQADFSAPGSLRREGEGFALEPVPGTVIHARRVITTAGEGTEQLLVNHGLKGPAMQRRPLHMAMVCAQNLPPVYAHCIGTGSKPVVTITTHFLPDGRKVWYLGGQLAEDGVEADTGTLIERARKLLNDLLPWISLDGAQWSTLRINRAEPRQSTLTRPDSAFMAAEGPLMVCWPTKLALSPNLADEVLKQLREEEVFPATPQPDLHLHDLPAPLMSPTPWEEAFAS
ncbi:MAG: FAD-dependent oxidoreductase [Gammaproteobacteria bacterium]|nr:MAG: FAD-dependent oxidoreductase [Gammaproteobacteria bacterium]